MLRVPENVRGEDAAALTVAVASKHLALGRDKFPGDAHTSLLTVEHALSAAGPPDGTALAR